MIQIGRWNGDYSFSNQEINKARGFGKTNFHIDILTVDDNNFIGTVQDDLNTGGTEGVGEVKGKVTGDKIEFVKLMPIMTLLVDKKGTKKTFNRKHRPIYYTGQFSSDRKTISGNWKFKFGFIWMGIIPIPVVPSKGTWTMKLKE
jgi:hypothetical protein